MPDFEDELQLVASQAAEDLQPMSAAEVMRRGTSRRRRRAALDAVAALAVAGAIAGGVLSISSASSAGRPGPQMPASRCSGCPARYGASYGAGNTATHAEADVERLAAITGRRESGPVAVAVAHIARQPAGARGYAGGPRPAPG